jgi:hypothetical protein
LPSTVWINKVPVAVAVPPAGVEEFDPATGGEFEVTTGVFAKGTR